MQLSPHSEFSKLKLAKSYYYPAYYLILQTKPGSSLVESPDSPELEIFKVQSEATLKLRAEYLYLRGLENLYVSRKYEQARNLFEEAMKMREDKLSWVVRCIC